MPPNHAQRPNPLPCPSNEPSSRKNKRSSPSSAQSPNLFPLHRPQSAPHAAAVSHEEACSVQQARWPRKAPGVVALQVVSTVVMSKAFCPHKDFNLEWQQVRWVGLRMSVGRGGRVPLHRIIIGGLRVLRHDRLEWAHLRLFRHRRSYHHLIRRIDDFPMRPWLSPGEVCRDLRGSRHGRV